MPDKVDIWMPLYIGDYLADTSHLDATRHGVYLLLLMHYWRRGPLAADKRGLVNIARVPDDSWAIVDAVLQEFFHLAEDGLWHQKRQDAERERAGSQKRRGTAGASAKWGEKSSSEQGKLTRSQRLAEARQIATHTEREWQSMQAFCRHSCVRCGVTDQPLVRDHVIPIYQGGSDGIDNIQPLCRKCNASKGPERQDFRPDGWQDACKTPASSLQNAWTLPLPSPLPDTSLKAKTPAKGKPSAESLTLYGVYPRKVGKTIALKAIDKALKAESFEALLLAVQRWAKKVSREGIEERFIPHPSTWFNQGRYLDEEFERSKPAQKVAQTDEESYLVWQSMSAEFREANPWTN